MYYIVETEEQLSRLDAKEEAYFKVITGNDFVHPMLTFVSLVYYNSGDKGYVLCINHSEGFKLKMSSVERFLKKHSKLYTLDKKLQSYFVNHKNVVDVYFTILDHTNSHDQLDLQTKVHTDFYAKHYENPEINTIIPIAKHYEACELEYKRIKDYFGIESNSEFLEDLVKAYKSVEVNGIGVDVRSIKEKYSFKCPEHSILGSKVYSYYNVYNLTSRPTNSFNGINFLAIPKEGEFRQCFVADNYFVEFDFDAYHLRLIAKLVGFEFPDSEDSIHTYLAKQYFETEEVTEELYKKSKTISFQIMYGGVSRKYKNIPFFKAIDDYSKKIFEQYKSWGGYQLPTGRTIKASEDMNAAKLFNYVIQNLETKENVYKILKLQDYLSGTNTKLVMITYDSFLFDYDPNEGKEVLKDIKDILTEGCMKVKHKHGQTYSF